MLRADSPGDGNLGRSLADSLDLSSPVPPLDDRQLDTIRRLLEEVRAAAGVTSLKGISSSYQRDRSVSLADLLGRGDRAKLELDDVQRAIDLERWQRWIQAAEQALNPPAPPPPPPAPALPSQLGPFRWDPITFDNGVPVGGWAELTLYQDGSHQFNGHFHDSGAPSYNSSIVWAIKDTTTNIAYTVQHSGHMAGTFESGSRDDDWSDDSAPNAELAAAWPTLCDGWVYNAQATMNGDFNAIIGYVLSAVGTVLAIVAL